MQNLNMQILRRQVVDRQRFFPRLFVAVSAGLLVGGCASSPGPASVDPAGASYNANNPQTFLSYANIEQAKGVAMGSAVSKGWQVADSSDRALLLERPLNSAAAESFAPGSSVGATPPKILVKTEFFERGNGVDVVLSATAVAFAGTENEKREDVTEAYRPDLERSLASLQSTWAKSQGRVATATPPTPTSGAPVVVDPNVPLAPMPGDPSSVQAASTASAGEPGTGIGTGWIGTSGAAASTAGAGQSGSLPPVETRGLSDPYAQAAAPTSSAGVEDLSQQPYASDSMVVLNEPVNEGIWAYYAEHYARVRGCALTGNGAELVEKTQEYELHRVPCEGGQMFEVRCNAGVCRGL
jgi:hypothetical protein